MSTLQTVIVFPLVFLAILFLFSLGPVFYVRTEEAVVFCYDSVGENVRTQELYKADIVPVSDDYSWIRVEVSAEKMHYLVHGIRDSVKILDTEG